MFDNHFNNSIVLLIFAILISITTFMSSFLRQQPRDYNPVQPLTAMAPAFISGNVSIQISATPEHLPNDLVSVWVRSDVYRDKYTQTTSVEATRFSKVEVDCKRLEIKLDKQMVYDNRMNELFERTFKSGFDYPGDKLDTLIIAFTCGIDIKLNEAAPAKSGPTNKIFY